MLLKRKPKNSAKNRFATLQVEINPLVNKLEYTNNKKPSKPSLPNVFEPSKLLLPTNFLESCLHQLSGSCNTSNCICQASPASFGKSPKLPKLQNALYTLNRCGLRLDTNLLSRYDNGRGKEKWLQWFLSQGWIALSLKDGCVML